MPTSNLDGPLFVYGGMGYLYSGATGGPVVPDVDTDAGPSGFYQGTAVPDVRFFFSKDQTTGYQGRVPSFLSHAQLESTDAVPSAFAVAGIAAAQNATSGTALTLVSASATGITVNVPIMPFSGQGFLNGGAVTIAPVVLDFGFAFGTTTAASTTVTVADSTKFTVGMPLVIADAGNSAGTAALLTWVTGTPTATTITVNDPAVSAQTATAIGTGNFWSAQGPIVSGAIGGGGSVLGYPTYHLPYLAQGPGLFLDPRQAIARGVSIAGETGGAGGTFIVRGWDIYWEPMAEAITVGAGAVTGYGKRAFKAIASVTPQFTDAHTYSVGTSDVFGLHFRCDTWASLDATWNAASMTTSTGWTGAVITNPATATSGDVRGTVQVSAIGGGSGIGANDSNGTITSLVMTGRELSLSQSIPLYNAIGGTPGNSVPMFGVTQFTE